MRALHDPALLATGALGGWTVGGPAGAAGGFIIGGAVAFGITIAEARALAAPCWHINDTKEMVKRMAWDYCCRKGKCCKERDYPKRGVR